MSKASHQVQLLLHALPCLERAAEGMHTYFQFYIISFRKQYFAGKKGVGNNRQYNFKWCDTFHEYFLSSSDTKQNCSSSRMGEREACLGLLLFFLHRAEEGEFHASVV